MVILVMNHFVCFRSFYREYLRETGSNGFYRILLGFLWCLDIIDFLLKVKLSIDARNFVIEGLKGFELIL